MKLDPRFLSLLVIFAGCAWQGGGPPPSTAALPDTDRLDRALAIAGATNRNILVEYTSQGCSESRSMQRRALSDPDVKAVLGEVVYVRVEKGRNAQAFERRWGEQGTPSFLVLRPDGRPAGSLVTGAIATEEFVRYVAWARTADGPEPDFTAGGT